MYSLKLRVSSRLAQIFPSGETVEELRVGIEAGSQSQPVTYAQVHKRAEQLVKEGKAKFLRPKYFFRFSVNNRRKKLMKRMVKRIAVLADDQAGRISKLMRKNHIYRFPPLVYSPTAAANLGTTSFARGSLAPTMKNLPIRLFSNKDVTCQVTFSRIEGDMILYAAYSHELPRCGVKAGLSLTNYASSYCTDLLLTRRLHTGCTEVYNFEATFGMGARICAAMKGAVDRGLNIPQSTKRFPGFDPEANEFNAEVHRKHIFGVHVADYMRQLAEEDDEAYKRQFYAYIKLGITADSVEGIFKAAHANIRADPARQKKAVKTGLKAKRWNLKKLTLKQCKANVAHERADWKEKIASGEIEF